MLLSRVNALQGLDRRDFNKITSVFSQGKEEILSGSFSFSLNIWVVSCFRRGISFPTFLFKTFCFDYAVLIFLCSNSVGSFQESLEINQFKFVISTNLNFQNLFLPR